MAYRTQKHSKILPCTAMIAVLIMLIAISNLIKGGIPMVKHGILLCYAVFVCWYIVRFVSTEYIYRLDDEKLTFIKFQSKRETEVLSIKISDIMFIGRRKNKKGRQHFDGQYMRKLKIEASKIILMELKRRIPDNVRIGYLNKGEPIDGNY